MMFSENDRTPPPEKLDTPSSSISVTPLGLGMGKGRAVSIDSRDFNVFPLLDEDTGRERNEEGENLHVFTKYLKF